MNPAHITGRITPIQLATDEAIETRYKLVFNIIILNKAINAPNIIGMNIPSRLMITSLIYEYI